jgi:galactose mutarotase-like enzyme
LLLPQAQPTPIVGRRMALDDALFEPDVIILDQLHSRSLTYAAPGGPRLQIGFPDARYLGIWTRPGAPFLCIEPWQGITDPVGFAGEFRSKPGIFLVPPGATQSLCMTVAVSEP